MFSGLNYRWGRLRFLNSGDPDLPDRWRGAFLITRDASRAARMWKLLAALNGEDRLVVGSIAVTLGGAGLGAWLAEPRVFGFTALAVISMLLIGWGITRSPRLAWLLVFGLV